MLRHFIRSRVALVTAALVNIVFRNQTENVN